MTRLDLKGKVLVEVGTDSDIQTFVLTADKPLVMKPEVLAAATSLTIKLIEG